MTKKKAKGLAALKVSPVTFDAENHRYFLGDKELSGITSLLGRTVFADKYKDVPQESLNKAAERGSNVHYEVSMYESASIAPECTEAKNYVEKIRPQLKVLLSEYLVSDEQHFASSIDVVAEDGDGVALYDIKTNKAGIDKDYVSWQLSCYAHLFEMQNPDVKVKALAGIWLSDDNAEIVPVNRIADDIIADMMAKDAEGLPFLNPMATETEAMAQYLTLDEEYRILQERIKELDDLKAKALAEIDKTLEEYGCFSLETEHLKFTRVAPTTRQSFDTAKFKKEHPDMVDSYMKSSVVNGYLKVTVR